MFWSWSMWNKVYFLARVRDGDNSGQHKNLFSDISWIQKKVRYLRIGVFSPTLYRIGGGEFVAISMINALKQQGYKVIVSVNKKIDQTRMAKFFGKEVDIDDQIIFPFHLFPPYDRYNLYTIALQSYILKLKCDILIDVYALYPFPWSDVTYFMGSKFLKQSSIPSVRNSFFLPYYKLLKSTKRSNRKIFLPCSKYSAEILTETFPSKDIQLYVLYPPVRTKFFNPAESNFDEPRENVSITISRISREKRLDAIPRIAKLTDKSISFVIAGSCESRETLRWLLKEIKKLKVTDRVTVLTDVSQDQLRTLLWKSKVYLHTKKNELFGITIAEGLSSGCTPVVHDSGAPREFIPEHLRYRSVEDAATKIEKAISEWSPEYAEKTSRIAARFDENEFSERFMDVINSRAKGE